MDIVMALLAVVVALCCLLTLVVSEIKDYRKRAAANKVPDGASTIDKQ